MTGRIFQKGALKIFIFLIVLTLGGFLFYKQTTMPKILENFESHQWETAKEETLIGVISDTHIPGRAKTLPKEIREIFKGVDLIIHSGDIENLETLKELEKITQVFAVEGNMDPKETKEKLPERISVKIFNFKIGIVHSLFPFWLGSHFNWLQEKVAKKLAQNQDFDILIFGHTHRPFLKELNFEGKKVLLINPGSPTAPFFSQPSVAILKINPQNFEAKIIYLPR